MGKIMNKLLMAAMDTYQAQKTEALAHLDLLFNDAVQIGEHSDLLTEVKKWTDSLSQAEENLETLKRNFDINQSK
jgi:sulfopyruvate decarboxylase TPP-binding subunit